MRQLSTVVMAGIGAGLYVACAPALAAEHSGAQAAATGQSVSQSQQGVADPAPERAAGASEVEAPENPVHTPATDDAAPPSQAPKTVVPGAESKTIYVSPEKARELKASGKAKPKSEHPGEAVEHPGDSAGQ